MINLSDSERRENGCISIEALPAATLRLVHVEPGIECVSIYPERESSTLNESFVILRPVADAAPALGLFGHASELSRRIASATIYATTPQAF